MRNFEELRVAMAGVYGIISQNKNDRIKYDAYKINIEPVNPENYRSMREVYGLDS